MNTLTRAALALAAAGLTLAGCGGGDSDAPKPTAHESWAASLCKALEPTTEAITPPATSDSDVAASKQAIVDFLTTLHDRLEAQADVLADVGAPPDIDAAAYDKAKQSLASGAATLDGVIGRLQDAEPKDAAQMQESLLQVSESLAESSSYQGPLAELSASDERLAAAFENDETCAKIMS